MPLINQAGTGRTVKNQINGKVISSKRAATRELTGPQIGVGINFSRSLGGYGFLSSDNSANYPIYRVIRKDPTVAIGRMAIAAPILTVPWAYEQTDKAPDKAKDFIEETVNRIRARVMHAAVYNTIDYGWSSYELIFAKDGKYVIVDEAKPLYPDITDILIDLKTGARVGLYQWDDVVLDNAKSLVISQDVEGSNWYGYPVLENVRRCTTDYYEVQDGAARYDKKIAGSHWIIHYPDTGEMINYNGTPTSADTIAQSLLLDLESSGNIAVPDTMAAYLDTLNTGAKNTHQWDIQLLYDSGANHVAFMDRSKYLDALKLRGIGLTERSMIEGSHGTKAEAGEHALVSIQVIELRNKNIISELNKQLVNRLLTINFGEEYVDTVYIESAPIMDDEKEFFKILYQSWMDRYTPFAQDEVQSQLDINAIRKRLNLPIEVNDGDKLSDTILQPWGQERVARPGPEPDTTQSTRR